MSDRQNGKILVTPLAHKAVPDEIDLNNQIVSELKRLYEAIEHGPIPDIFLDLLAWLDSVERTRKPKSQA